MKHMAAFSFVLFSVLLLTSCVTKRQHSSFMEYPGVPFYFSYTAGDVSVTVDHVQETTIAEQIRRITETYLEANQNRDFPADKTLFLDIVVSQRSFMQNVELYNGIYVACTVRDDGGLRYAQENEYIATKNTVVNTAEQNTIMTRILKRLLKSQSQRARDIEKMHKEREKAQKKKA